ncbi:hypothetical protein [Rhizobium sp. A37_96]
MVGIVSGAPPAGQCRRRTPEFWHGGNHFAIRKGGPIYSDVDGKSVRDISSRATVVIATVRPSLPIFSIQIQQRRRSRIHFNYDVERAILSRQENVACAI